MLAVLLSVAGSGPDLAHAALDKWTLDAFAAAGE